MASTDVCLYQPFQCLASIPLNVEAQTRRLGVPESIASFAASFGATIGQNGLCRFASGNAGGDGCAYGGH